MQDKAQIKKKLFEVKNVDISRWSGIILKSYYNSIVFLSCGFFPHCATGIGSVVFSFERKKTTTKMSQFYLMKEIWMDSQNHAEKKFSAI